MKNYIDFLTDIVELIVLTSSYISAKIRSFIAWQKKMTWFDILESPLIWDSRIPTLKKFSGKLMSLKITSSQKKWISFFSECLQPKCRAAEFAVVFAKPHNFFEVLKIFYEYLFEYFRSLLQTRRWKCMQ